MPQTSIPKPSLVDLPASYLLEQRILPLDVLPDRVHVAYAGQPDAQTLAELAAHFGRAVSLEEWPEDELLAGIDDAVADGDESAADLIEDLRDDPVAGGAPNPDQHSVSDRLEELANRAPVVRLVNLLITEAIEARASDVHLESDADGLVVRYRVDGVLQPAPSPPPHLSPAIVSRLKVMAELDIAERRRPQDGRVRFTVPGRGSDPADSVDLRVSTLPTLRGESVVLRILERGRRIFELEALGLDDDALGALSHFVRRPHGMLLATGPTGSGKSTTLHALLRRLRTGREKIVSVEDPVEFEAKGVCQVPVRAKTGVTFGSILRSILRQDPDVLLVGEMRDRETAEICTQAALTGHLVLSTLHTNDAPLALTRLRELGVPEYLVSSTVELVLAQRLVRTVCDDCVEEESPTPTSVEPARTFGITIDTVRRGAGCQACRGTGYRGRIGVFEMLAVDDDLRRAVTAREGSGRLRECARASGMRPLAMDGWRQVAAGRTTPEEVLRVLAA